MIAHWCSLVLVLFSLTDGLRAQGPRVLVVEPSGGSPYATIQEAVDAAGDGDVVLVREGTYPGFAVVGKGVVVASDRGASVSSGKVEILDIPDGRLCALLGLEVQSDLGPGLWVQNSPGAVRLQDCVLRGADGDPGGAGDGGAGARVEWCGNVSFTGCTLIGGRDSGWSLGDYLRGGSGLHVVFSSAALYGGSSLGGGGQERPEFDAGTGGMGVRVESSFVFIGGAELVGGDGASTQEFCAYSGSGGHGLGAVLGSEVHLKDNHLVGGMGGACNDCVLCNCCYTPPDGQAEWADASSSIVPVSGTLPSISLPSVSIESVLDRGTGRGEVGQWLQLAEGAELRFEFLREAEGVVLIEQPVQGRVPLGVISAHGDSFLTQEAPVLPEGAEAMVRFQQTLALEPGGQGRKLGAPLVRVVLDCAFTPDCNGNGISDGCETLAGTIGDCDRDAIPDECQTLVDCDGDGVHDPCQIAAEPSLDCNSSGILDACEDLSIVEVENLIPPIPDSAVFTGASLAVLPDRLAMGDPFSTLPGSGSGAVTVHERDPGGSFGPPTMLVSSAVPPENLFGISVALRHDRLAVGTIRSVELFELGDQGWELRSVLQENPAVPGDNFGSTVLWTPEGRLVVGAESWKVSGGNAVHIFEELAPWSYTQTATLVEPAAGPGASSFATAIAVSRGRIAVGSPRTNGPGSRVFVFEHSSSGWSLAATIEPPPGAPYRFGGSLELEGDLLVVGAAGTHSQLGAVFVYRHDGADYGLERRIDPSDAPADTEGFGAAVSLRAPSLWIGAPFQDNLSMESGALYRYLVDSEGDWVFQDKYVHPLSTASSAYFGYRIARSSTGDIALVSCPNGVTEQGATGFVELRVGEEDCNGNGIPDICDLAGGTSTDLDLDGIPDECASDRQR